MADNRSRRIARAIFRTNPVAAQAYLDHAHVREGIERAATEANAVVMPDKRTQEPHVVLISHGIRITTLGDGPGAGLAVLAQPPTKRKRVRG